MGLWDYDYNVGKAPKLARGYLGALRERKSARSSYSNSLGVSAIAKINPGVFSYRRNHLQLVGSGR